VELHNLFTSQNVLPVIKSRRMRWAGHVAHMEEMRNAYRILVRKPEVKKLLGRHRHRWEDNIRMNMGEMRGGVVNWIHLDHVRDQWRALVNTAMNTCSSSAATNVDEIFSGYQLRQVSVWNRRFEDHFGDHHHHQGYDDDDDDDDRDGPRNVGSIQTADVADSPRRLYRTVMKLRVS
jgi:hypothetical protein